MISATIAAATVVGVAMKGSVVEAQGMVAGAAAPGTMEGTFTIPYSEFDDSEPSGCGNEFVGCTGTLFECPECVPHEINGTITVLDDCTFRVQGWQFDGIGPAVEWWGSTQDGVDESFPYPETAIKIGELGAPGSYQLGSLHGGDSDIVVRLGLDASGNQIELSDAINHISVWCEDFMVDFGNTPITCDAKAPGAAADAEGATPPAAEAAAEGATPPGEEADAEGTTPPAGEAAAEGADEEETEAEETTEAGDADTDTGDAATATTTEAISSVSSMHSAVGTAAAVGALGLALL